jgi:hypothetical protein
MLAESPEGWRAYVDIVDDPGFDGFTADQVIAAVTEDYGFSFLVIVDALAIGPEVHAVARGGSAPRGGAIVPCCAGRGAVQSVENNLSLANMDFFEFAESVGPDGVFRGFG